MTWRTMPTKDPNKNNNRLNSNKASNKRLCWNIDFNIIVSLVVQLVRNGLEYIIQTAANLGEQKNDNNSNQHKDQTVLNEGLALFILHHERSQPKPNIWQHKIYPPLENFVYINIINGLTKIVKTQFKEILISGLKVITGKTKSDGISCKVLLTSLLRFFYYYRVQNYFAKSIFIFSW